MTWLEPSIPADGAGPAVLRLELAPLAEPSGRLGAIDAVAATVLLAPVDASGTRIEHLPVGLQLRGGDAPSVVERFTVVWPPERADAERADRR